MSGRCYIRVHEVHEVRRDLRAADNRKKKEGLIHSLNCNSTYELNP